MTVLRAFTFVQIWGSHCWSKRAKVRCSLGCTLSPHLEGYVVPVYPQHVSVYLQYLQYPSHRPPNRRGFTADPLVWCELRVWHHWHFYSRNNWGADIHFFFHLLKCLCNEKNHIFKTKCKEKKFKDWGRWCLPKQKFFFEISNSWL